MPVDQEFTCKAGNQVMGFPKTVQDLSVTNRAGRIRFALDIDGETEFALSFTEPDQAGEPTRVETGSYSYLGGEPHETPLSMEMGSGMIDAQSVEIELGDGLLAGELRTLGLPAKPDFGTWGTGLTATFQLGHRLGG